MLIGLIDIEPKINNTALMQISNYHKKLGDSVEWAAPLDYDRFDKLYCSSLFDFTDKSQVPYRAICGGTGFDLTTKLPFDCEYDYLLYPKCDYSMVWFSRGCILNCPWCIVRQKEGKLHPVSPKNLNPNGKYIKIMDNNFFANTRWHKNMERLQITGRPVDFQGVDCRIITHFQAYTLTKLKHLKQIRIAWDEPKDEELVIAGIKRMTEYIKPYKIMCYVLIGYYDDPESDLHRVETLRQLGIDPFVMPFDKKDLYQKAFARWVNIKPIFKKVLWKDYWQRVLKQENAGNGWK